MNDGIYTSASYARISLLERRARAARGLLRKRQEQRLEYDWRAQAFDKQLPPPISDPWTYCLLLAGRGGGKTRSLVEWLREAKATHSPLAIIARTAADVRDVLVEGPAGIKAMAPPWDYPVYEPTKRRITWPNGAVATTYSAEEPDSLRGPQHAAAICDELATWSNMEAWSNFELGLRLGQNPKCVIATTPRPIPVIKQLVKRADDGDPAVVVRRWSTYENREHLAPSFFEHIVSQYEGTRRGRQEIEGDILEDMDGALWTYKMIEEARIPMDSVSYNEYGRPANFARIVVAIDPAMTAGEESNETGIIVAGKDIRGHATILADRSGRYVPIGDEGNPGWARIADALYKQYHADRVVAEVNNGGDMVEATMRMVNPSISYTPVTATRGKFVRAEPVAALYEQGRVHHLGMMVELEDQMVMFAVDPAVRKQMAPMVTNKRSTSPDRVDALVWALFDLIVGQDNVDLNMWRRLAR